MTAVPNHALRELRAGKLAIGLGVRNARTVDIAQMAKTSGFDWLFIDCEHSSMDLETVNRGQTPIFATYPVQAALRMTSRTSRPARFAMFTSASRLNWSILLFSSALSRG